MKRLFPVFLIFVVGIAVLADTWTHDGAIPSAGSGITQAELDAALASASVPEAAHADYADDAGSAAVVGSIAGHPVSALENDAGFMVRDEWSSGDSGNQNVVDRALYAGRADEAAVLDGGEQDPWAQSQGFATESWVGQQGYMLGSDYVRGEGNGNPNKVDHAHYAQRAYEADSADEADYASSAGQLSNGEQDPWAQSQGFVTESWIWNQGFISNESDPWASSQGFATESWVGSQGYLTSESDPWAQSQGFATENWVQSQQYIHSYDLDSAVNGLGYLTQSSFESPAGDMLINNHGYVKQSWTEQAIQDAIANAGYIVGTEVQGWEVDPWALSQLMPQEAENPASPTLFTPRRLADELIDVGSTARLWKAFGLSTNDWRLIYP